MKRKTEKGEGVNLINSGWRTYLPGAVFSAALLLLSDCSSVKEAGTQSLLRSARDTLSEQAMVGPQGNGAYVVTTSQIIDPAGKTLTFPGRPVDLALNPEGTILAVKNIQDLVFFDVIRQSILQVLPLPAGTSNTFTGIAWSNNGQKVWTTDTKGYIRSAKMTDGGVFDWDDAFHLPSAKILANGILAWEDEILIPESVRTARNMAYPGGFVLDEQQGLIYVTLNRYNSVEIVNLRTGKSEGRIPVGIAPYDIIIEKDKAYVTNWGGRLPVAGDQTALSSGTPVVVDPRTGIASSGTVSVIDLASQKVVKEIEVRLHPCGMVMNPDGSRLFVANANSDLISVIDTKTDEVIDEFSTKPMAELPFGSAPNALSIAPDGKTLYVANGGNNLIAVIDPASGLLNGLIPAGWYPGAVSLSRDGNTLFVANTKGVGGRDLGSRKKIGYKSNDHLGSVSFIPVPSNDTLEKYTVRAATNMRLPKIDQAIHLGKVRERVVPIPVKPGEKSVFKHVLYIIKENKTYDQVFGDLPQGNGDSTLCQFGRDLTPNHHSLAETFVLLDNAYCNGVLSADGHQWTDEGYVTDYLEKSFGGFARSYPYEGDDPLAFASSGFIWDNVLRHGLSFRNYGEFVKAVIEPKNATWTDVYHDYKNNTSHVKIQATSELHTLRPFLCPTFIGFPQTVPDVYRAREFIKELHACEAGDSLPNLMIMLLPNDHTTGTREGFPTPRASVADNDLALGQIVEAVSKSKFWKETAIFVIQDDPQSGLDHVDGKRTVALCISPYTRRGAVVSTQYNQNSILRTIELILGLPPMSQFDLTATPMTDCFTDRPDFSPYMALPSNIPLDELNPKLSSLKGKQKYWAKKSMEMPFDEVDLAEDDVLNRIVWYAVKGYDVPYPKLKR